MPDIKDKDSRSFNMSQIKGKNTKPELIVRKWLFSHGYRYRLHVKNLPGKPDIVLPKYRTVIFVNGCFWHGHDNCDFFVWPTSNVKFWYEKISTTKKRDELKVSQLKDLGWNVYIIWECEISNVVLSEPKNIIPCLAIEQKKKGLK